VSALPARTALPFDRVVVGNRGYSAQEFMRLPLSQRVRHILKREVTFYRGQDPVQPTLALSSLREAAVQSEQ